MFRLPLRPVRTEMQAKSANYHSVFAQFRERIWLGKRSRLQNESYTILARSRHLLSCCKRIVAGPASEYVDPFYTHLAATHSIPIHVAKMKSTMQLLSLALFVSYVIAADAHGEDAKKEMGPVAFMWPEDRPWTAYDDNTPPCGTSSGPVNRTDFPRSKYIVFCAQDVCS
jgi:hypothetical protein